MKRLALAALALAIGATLQPVASMADPPRAARTDVSTRADVSIDVTPRRVVMTHQSEWVTWQLSGANFDAFGAECRLHLRHQKTGRLYIDVPAYDGHTSGGWQVGDIWMPLGVFRPVAECNRPNSSSIDTYAGASDVVIRLGSRTTVRSVHRGTGRTTVTGVVKVWSRSRLAFTGWPGARVAVQVKKPSGWKTARTVTSGRGGAVRATLPTTSRSSWRLVALGNSRVWPSTHPVSADIPLSKSLRVEAGPERLAFTDTFESVQWSGSRTNGEPLKFCVAWVENKRTRKAVGDGPYLGENTHAGRMRIHHSVLEPGHHTVVLDCNDSGVAIDDILIKWGSRSGIRSVRRNAGHTSVQGVVKRWDTRARGFVGWSGARVAVQVKKPSGWKTVRTITSGSGGKVTATVATGGTGTWRLVPQETSQIWSSTSTAAKG